MMILRSTSYSVTLYKPNKIYNGFTLFTPLTTIPSNTWLIDMQGRFVHRWQLPGWVRLQAVLLPTGNLLFGLRDVDYEGPFADLVWCGGQLVEMDWDGNIVWRYEEPYADLHDWVRMRNGNTLIQKYVEVPRDIAVRVKGGVPGTERDGAILGYALQEISPEGKLVWEWLSYEHLDPDLDVIEPLYCRFMWPGWNSLVELPDGNIMACSFATSNIYIINKVKGDIKWRWGQGIISFPHNPSMLDNGNILVFDNGRYHVDIWPPDFSRVIEVNPNTNELEWEYKEENPVDFYSTYIGGCERLPNGNTLICEGARGRFFEVTPSGEMVWEYVVPFYARSVPGAVNFGLSNSVFRCHRYGPDYPGLQGKKLDPEKLSLWNQLYGPGAFGSPGVRVEGAPIAEKKVEKKVPQVEYRESKPSIGRPGKEKKVSARTKMLGY